MGCPDDNVLVAMVEQALEPTHFAEVEVHIDSCEHCRKIIAAAVAGRSLAVGTPAGQDDAEQFAAIIDVSINGRYVIDAVLGRGGMGTVYLARDLTLGREVALKLHRAGSGNDRLHREAIAMAKLAHPNVVTVFEVATVDDRLYVAMEYVRGETLRGWLAATPRKWRTIVDMLVQVGGGLAAAHAAGLIHRDFKPENVLVGEDGRPRVGDFGLARVGAGPSGMKPLLAGGSPDMMTVTGTLMGTPAYMAPEQLAGDAIDARCDQFAFCVVAWECLFDKRPYGGATMAALEEAMHHGELQRPQRTDVPQRVRDVLERGLAIDPAARYPDMTALLAALRVAATPRTKRYLALGLASAALLGGAAYAGVSLVGARRHAAECDAAGAKFRDAFGVAKREEIRRAFLASGSPVALVSFERTAVVLDKYTASLAKQATASCRGIDEPMRMTAARRACLAEKQSEVVALVDVFAKPDAMVISRAPSAAWTVFDPAPCQDAAMLLARPILASSSVADEVKKLSRARALDDAGRYADALALVKPLIESARARKDRNLELAALMTMAHVQSEVAGPEEIAPVYHEAVQLAETLGRDLDAAGAFAGLAHLAGVVQHDYQTAHRYIALARAKLARLGDGNLAIRGQLFMTEAQILVEENRLGEAERAMRQGVATLEQALGGEHPSVGAAMGTLAQILRFQYKETEALDMAKRTHAVLLGALGEDHPNVAGAELTIAQSLVDARQFADARQRLVKADRVFARVFGDDHPVRASIAANLGQIELAQENWDGARAAYERALAIIERTQGPESLEASGARRDIARSLAEGGRMDDALREQQRAIDILDKNGVDGEPRLPTALAEMAEYQLFVKKPLDALANAERGFAIAVKRKADANPSDLADAKFLLARALWETGRDRARARALALEAQPHAQSGMRTAVDTWLREHPL